MLANIDPEQVAPIALAAAAGWLLFGDKIRSAWGTWGKVGRSDEAGGDLIRLVTAADLLVKHFDKIGDSEGSQAARTAAGRLFAAKPKPPSLQDWIMQGKPEIKPEAKQ